jgi:hypothetical protein
MLNPMKVTGQRRESGRIPRRKKRDVRLRRDGSFVNEDGTKGSDANEIPYDWVYQLNYYTMTKP